MIEIMRRMGWTVAPGWTPLNANVCRRCTHEVLWCEQGARKTPFNRDGSRHPRNCRIGIGNVRPREQGAGPLRSCPLCDDRDIRYSPRDLPRHLDAYHRHITAAITDIT